MPTAQVNWKGNFDQLIKTTELIAVKFGRVDYICEGIPEPNLVQIHGEKI